MVDHEAGSMVDEVAFPTLTDSEIAAIEALGSRRSVSAGEYLYREGDARYDFYVVASGAVEIALQADGEERIVARGGGGVRPPPARSPASRRAREEPPRSAS